MLIFKKVVLKLPVFQNIIQCKSIVNTMITETIQSSNDDFKIVGNLAYMSLRKTAGVTLTTHPTVINWLGKITDVNQSKSIIEKGLDGGTLKQFVTYLVFDAKRISKKVRIHNIKLLSDASDYGFQTLINKMAGIKQEVITIVKEPNPISILDGLIEGLKLTKQLQEQVTRIDNNLLQLNQFREETEQKQQEAIENLKSFPEPTIEVAPIALKELLNRLVRDYAITNNMNFGEVYTWVYREYRDRYHIDLIARGKNHKPKLTGIQYAEKHNLIEELYAIANELLIIKEQNI